MHGQCRSGLGIDYQRSTICKSARISCRRYRSGIETCVAAVCLNQIERQRQAYLPDPGTLRDGLWHGYLRLISAIGCGRSRIHVFLPVTVIKITPLAAKLKDLISGGIDR